MSGLAIEVTVPRDTASPAFARLSDGLQPSRLNPIVGRSAEAVYRKHLFGLDQNRGNPLGGVRTHFYAAAAKNVNWREVGDHVLISIPSVGLAQRYFGGTINPVTAKFLTIPARAEAYGKRASEFKDLEILFGRNGPYALARRAATLINVGRPNSKGLRLISRSGAQGGEVMFWLVKEVTQKPDPTVLPSEATVTAAVQKAVTTYVDLLISRAGGAN